MFLEAGRFLNALVEPKRNMHFLSELATEQFPSSLTSCCCCCLGDGDLYEIYTSSGEVEL